MDLKEQIIAEYLTQGCGFRKLAAKYGISRTTLCKWVTIHQGIYHLPTTTKQSNYPASSMNSSKKKRTSEQLQSTIACSILTLSGGLPNENHWMSRLS